MKWQTCDFYGIRNAEEIIMISLIFLMSMIINANTCIKFNLFLYNLQWWSWEKPYHIQNGVYLSKSFYLLRHKENFYFLHLNGIKIKITRIDSLWFLLGWRMLFQRLVEQNKQLHLYCSPMSSVCEWPLFQLLLLK